MNVSTLKSALTVILFFLSINCKATTYTTIANGPYTSNATWLGGDRPPNPLATGDVVNINHLVTFSSDLTFNGIVNIAAGKSLTGTKKITVNNGGIINNSGTLSTTDAIKINNGAVVNNFGSFSSNSSITVALGGTFNNNGSLNANTFDNSGTTNNSGTMTLTSTGVSLNNTATGVFNNTGTVDAWRIDNLGNMTNQGTLSTDEDFRNLGTLTNDTNATINVGQDFYNGDGLQNGTFDNSGTITVTDRFRNLNGDITGGGTISTCDFEQQLATSSTVQQVICCPDTGLAPVMNIDPSGIFDLNVTVIICGVLLPINFGDFTANYVEKKCELNWFTESEINNSFFTIERSKDGVNYEEIGQVQAKGISNVKSYYSLVDNSPLSGQSYYKIKQTDINGLVTELKTIISSIAMDEINLYPVPASRTLFIEGKNLKDSHIELKNNLGETFYPLFEIANEKIILHIEELKNGFYFLNILNDKISYSVKIVIKNN